MPPDGRESTRTSLGAEISYRSVSIQIVNAHFKPMDKRLPKLGRYTFGYHS